MMEIHDILLHILVALEREQAIEPTSLLHESLRDYMIRNQLTTVDELLEASQKLDISLANTPPTHSLDYIDIIINLFTTKYSINLKLKALANLEKSGTLSKHIKKHQPKYWDKYNSQVKTIQILKDIGLTNIL
jgi:acyl carrier protein